MDAIRSFLEKKGYSTVNADYYAKIKNWEDWFTCTVDDFHKTVFFNGITNVDKEIKMLGMAKTVCETWANLMMNERVKIGVGDDAQNKILIDILNANKFWTNANQLVELYCALGTGAFVEYLDGDDIRIDYIRASMIYPLSWDSRGIQECAFASNVHNSEGDCVYIQMHILENGKYKIENHMIIDDDEYGFKEIELPEDVEEVFYTNSDIPLFQIIKPNIINNYDLKNPMGISVYANAIDILKEIDMAFDALDVEIETGRRMVFLSADMFFTDENGEVRNIVGNKEKVLRYIGGMEQQMIKDFSPALRTNEIKETIQFQLNLLSEKCGMGTNQFEFTTRGTKTATEIISEDSDLYQSLKKHEIFLQQAIEGMVYAIQSLGGGFSIKEIQVNFDDSIIQDKYAERQQYKEEVAAGLMGPVEYRMRVYNEDEETAQSKIPEKADVMP